MQIHKKFTMTAIALGLCMYYSPLYANDMHHKKYNKRYKEVMILDKGVKRTLYIETSESNQSTGKNKSTTYSSKANISTDGIILRMKKNSLLNIADFEIQYGLKFKEKLSIGYYIFENVSGKSDVEVVRAILENEKNIDSVKPNWPKKNMPR